MPISSDRPWNGYYSSLSLSHRFALRVNVSSAEFHVTIMRYEISFQWRDDRSCPDVRRKLLNLINNLEYEHCCSLDWFRVNEIILGYYGEIYFCISSIDCQIFQNDGNGPRFRAIFDIMNHYSLHL